MPVEDPHARVGMLVCLLQRSMHGLRRSIPGQYSLQGGLCLKCCKISAVPDCPWNGLFKFAPGCSPASSLLPAVTMRTQGKLTSPSLLWSTEPPSNAGRRVSAAPGLPMPPEVTHVVPPLRMLTVAEGQCYLHCKNLCFFVST